MNSQLIISYYFNSDDNSTYLAPIKQHNNLLLNNFELISSNISTFLIMNKGYKINNDKKRFY